MLPVASGAPTVTYAEALAEFCTTSISQVDSVVVDRVKGHLLDTLAVGLAGSTAASSRAALRAIAVCGEGGASVFGSDHRLPLGDAALVNGTMAHALELDDDHRTAVLHPGAAVVPAALAAAEAVQASGTAVLRGVLAGYEVSCRLGEAFRGDLFRYGFHPTAVCGVFGAAAAAGVVVGLCKRPLVHAFGIAGTQASGLTAWRTNGSWIKRLHPGRAAQSGLIAARLAANGFTGPRDILEGEGGFFAAFGRGSAIDPDAITRGLGSHYRALGTAVKPYPCCRFAHGAIDLAREARERGVEANNVSVITVRLYRTGVLTYHTPPLNPVDAQFNLPYLAAVALTQGRVGISDFTSCAIRRVKILKLAQKVHVIEDDKFSATFPERYPTELAIEHRAGLFRHFSELPIGDPEAPQYRAHPVLLRREVEAKVRALLQETGFGERAEALTACVLSLEAVTDIAVLASLLRTRPEHSRKPIRGCRPKPAGESTQTGVDDETA